MPRRIRVGQELAPKAFCAGIREFVEDAKLIFFAHIGVRVTGGSKILSGRGAPKAASETRK